MQSPHAFYPTEEVSARSVASSRTGGESQTSYQRQTVQRQSLANVSPSKIQSVRRPSEAALPNSGRSVGSSHSGAQGWATTTSPVPRHPTPPATSAMTDARVHDEEYMLGLLSEPSHTYPAYAAAPGQMLPTGSVTPTHTALSVGEGDQGRFTQPSPPHTPPTAGLSPQGDDLVHEVLAINTLAMQRCREEQLDEATNLLNEAYLKLEANGSHGTTAGEDGAAHRPSSGGSNASRGTPAASAAGGGGLHYGDEDGGASGPAITDAQLLDELQSITLNNMGVVECHRGQPRQALSHFEAARQLEENWNMGSPSVALNTCAAYNALRMYDKATAAALETIDMLRALAVQRKRQRLLQRRQIESAQRLTGGETRKTPRQVRQREEEEVALLMAQDASEPVIADSENDALWGAAWHNLAVAQINTATEARRKAGTSNSTRQADTSEITNTLVIFQNAMRATQDLLGPKHPMTKAVVETYREARKALRSGGAFKQHRGQMTTPLPPVDPRDRATAELTAVAAPGKTRHGTMQQQKKDLTITFRGEATNGEKLTERMDAAPYPGAKSQSYRSRKHYTAANNFKGETQRTMTNLPAKRSTSQSQRSANTRSRSNKAKAWSRGPLRSMPLGDTLLQASELYGNPHPLLYTNANDVEAAAANTATGASQTRQGLPMSPTAPPLSQAAASQGAITSGRQTRPRPPLPENMSNEAYYAHYLALLEERDRLIQSRQQQAAADDDADATRDSPRLPAVRGGGGGGASITAGTRTDPPIVMHYPPGRTMVAAAATAAHTSVSADRDHDGSSLMTQPALDAPSAHSTTAHFSSPDEHARYLLLAQPPTVATMAASPSPSMAERQEEEEATAAAAAQVSPVPSQPPLSSATQTDATASSQGVPARELFDAMWVTTDDTLLQRQGKRDFGRPAYYVPTTTLLQTFQRQEEAEAAERRASGQHLVGPDTRTSVMYYSEEVQASENEEEEEEEKNEEEGDYEELDGEDASDHGAEEEEEEEEEEERSPSAGNEMPAPRERANTAQHDEDEEAEEEL